MASSIMDFIEENYEVLLRFAVRLTGNWTDGEDVLQTVAVKICQKQDMLGNLANCKSYLMVCIRNAVLNQKRTRARQKIADGSFEKREGFLADPNAEGAFELVEWIESLDQHLGYYDERSRKAFIAYYVDQAPLEDVAASLGLSKRKTVRKFESMRNYLKRRCRHLFIQLSVLLLM